MAFYIKPGKGNALDHTFCHLKFPFKIVASITFFINFLINRAPLQNLK